MKDSTVVKKSDGTNLKLNFQFENGLPIKDVIYPSYQVAKEDYQYAVYVYFKESELKQVNFLEITGYSIEEGISNKIWLLAKDYYIVFENLNNIIVREMHSKKLGFCFFDINNQFIKGIKFE